MTLKQYFSAAGSRFTQKDAAVIGPVLDEMYERTPKGLLLAADVVDQAKRPNSPLHQYFEWDDKKAGANWRIEQAKNMMRSIEVRVVKKDGTSKTHKAYAPANTTLNPQSDCFVAVNVIRQSPPHQKSIAERAKQELDAWRIRYSTYVAISPSMREDCDQLSEIVDRIIAKLEQANAKSAA